jgi:Fe-S cluster assembly ATP-binding protein
MANILSITNLWVNTVDGKEILKGVNLKVRKGETHVIMGPNGGGKSTLAQVIMGHPGFKIIRGKIKLGNKIVNSMSPDIRAKLGLFLGFQYPVEVPGVNFASFLRMAINGNSLRKISPIAFRKELGEQANKLAFSDDLVTRSLNEGFSGGEKKKAEVLQMIILKPKFAILDEPDSGLDVDAIKYITQAISSIKDPPGMLLITHYQKLLDIIKPNFVHLLVKGIIVKSGDAALAIEIEKYGYEKFQK